jgi:hypothetical protein
LLLPTDIGDGQVMLLDHTVEERFITTAPHLLNLDRLDCLQ